MTEGDGTGEYVGDILLVKLMSLKPEVGNWGLVFLCGEMDKWWAHSISQEKYLV